MSYQTEIKLIGQPRSVKLEYRVIATNPAGQSVPSNIVAVGFVGEVRVQITEHQIQIV